MKINGSKFTMTMVRVQDTTLEAGQVTCLHDIVGVPFKDLGADPALLPVPQLDEHVIGGRQNVWQRGVNSNAPAQTHSSTEGDHHRGNCTARAMRGDVCWDAA